jgi:hypothetical protein
MRGRRSNFASEAGPSTATNPQLGTRFFLLFFVNGKRSGDNASSIFETIAFEVKNGENCV